MQALSSRETPPKIYKCLINDIFSDFQNCKNRSIELYNLVDYLSITDIYTDQRPFNKPIIVPKQQ